MDVPLRMGFGEHRIQHIHFTKLFGSLGAVFQHGAHRSVAVDIGVFPFDIVIRRRFEGQILVNAHQLGVHVANAGTLCPIEDILFGGTGMSVFNQNLFYHVLHLLYRRAGLVQFVSQVSDDLFGQFFSHFPVVAAQNLRSLIDGVSDLARVERHLPPVSLDNCFDHVTTSSPYGSKNSVFNKGARGRYSAGLPAEKYPHSILFMWLYTNNHHNILWFANSFYCIAG